MKLTKIKRQNYERQKIIQKRQLDSIQIKSSQKQTNMNTEYNQKFTTHHQDSSIKSSQIESQSRASRQNHHKRSLCHQEIMSENYDDDGFQDDELYNEESSLPLCMKEYYINEKQVKMPNSSQRVSEQNLHQCNSTNLDPHDTATQNNTLTKAACCHSFNQSPTHPFAHSQAQYFHQAVTQRNKILSIQLQNQRIKNLHFQKMLSILIDQDEVQKQHFTKMKEEYEGKIERFTEIEKDNRSLNMRCEELEKESQHYKELIYIANGNYQLLEAKLEEANERIASLQLQREEREKGYHEKLQNLKQVMKSLMANLKADSFNSQQKDQSPYFRIDTNDAFTGQNCYSFGDQDMNLRQKKDKNTNRNQSTKQQFFNSALNQGKSGNKTSQSMKDTNGKANNMTKKPFEKENVYLTEKFEDSFESKNFSSTKTTAINKLKSPKNLAVEENYRKLFMKTLNSSSQKHKTTQS